MKYTAVIAMAVMAAVTNAQLSALPSCALTCLATGIPTTGCALTDFKCSCSNAAFVESSYACVQAGCNEADQEKARAATIKLCGDAGVEITLPPGGTPPPPSSSAVPPPPSSTAAPPPSSDVPPPPSTVIPTPTAKPTPPPGGGDDSDDEGGKCCRPCKCCKPKKGKAQRRR